MAIDKSFVARDPFTGFAYLEVAFTLDTNEHAVLSRDELTWRLRLTSE